MNKQWNLSFHSISIGSFFPNKLGRSLHNPELLHMAKELWKLTTNHKEFERILMECKIDVKLRPALL
jgi:hypothetical protein